MKMATATVVDESSVADPRTGRELRPRSHGAGERGGDDDEIGSEPSADDTAVRDGSRGEPGRVPPMTPSSIALPSSPERPALQKYLVAWIPIALISVAVGQLLRPFYPLFGELNLATTLRQIHVVTTLVLNAALLAYVSVAMRVWPPSSRSEAVRVGALWLVLSLVAVVLLHLARGTLAYFLPSFNLLAGNLSVFAYLVVAAGPYWFYTRSLRASPSRSSLPIATMLVFGVLEGAAIVVGLHARPPDELLGLLVLGVATGPTMLLSILDEHGPRLYSSLVAILWAAAIGYGLGKSPKPRWLWIAIVVWVIASVAPVAALTIGLRGMGGP
jgi:hypothetical protein